MINHQKSILRLLYTTRPRQALDAETIRKRCNIENSERALKLCQELQNDGTIIGANTPKGWVFWTDFTEHCEHAVRLLYKLPSPAMVGTVCYPNYPITDGLIRTVKTPHRERWTR